MVLRKLLQDHRDEILSRFAERVRRGPFPSDQLSASVLLDGLPWFLDRVSLDLGGASRPESPGEDSAAAESGAQHAQQRHELGFDVVAVAREWAIVRDVILEMVLEREGLLDLMEYQTLSRHVSMAAIASIQEHVELSQRERDRLNAQHVGFLVHDLRNQLTGATAALSWMQMAPQHVARAVETIEASLSALTRLLDQELTIARLTSLKGGASLQVRPLLVAELLSLAAGEIRPLAAVRDVQVTTECPPGLALQGDLRLLRSALVNLVGNAVKFTRPSSTVALLAVASDTTVEISVSDACGGLADGVGETLFADHEQVGEDRSGFGLGLAICRQAVEAHGGTVAVQNRPGLGCTFVISLARGAA